MLIEQLFQKPIKCRIREKNLKQTTEKYLLDASCFNNCNLQQVCKYQVAASLIFAACFSIDAFNGLAASCSIRLVKTYYPHACCKLL